MLQVVILGTAAGGGFPQWNCACDNCRLARRGLLPPRLQSSLAVSGDGGGWHLVNASPDVCRQIDQFLRPRLADRGAARDVPVGSIFLTNADLDHTLGLFQLREGEPLTVIAPPAVRESLERGPGVESVLDAYAGANWLAASQDWQRVDGTGLEARAVVLKGGGPPRYDSEAAAGTHAVGYVFRNGGSTVGVFPDVAVIDDELLAELQTCDRVWFDGTFWDEDELVRLAFSARSAAEMGHVPVSESLPRLSGLGPDRVSYLHVNNTNPILRPDSDERRRVDAANLRVAEDGDHFVF